MCAGCGMMRCIDCSLEGNPYIMVCCACGQSWCSDCKGVGLCLSCNKTKCTDCDPLIAISQECTDCRLKGSDGQAAGN
jgi:hypothetical protein